MRVPAAPQPQDSKTPHVEAYLGPRPCFHLIWGPLFALVLCCFSNTSKAIIPSINIIQWVLCFSWGNAEDVIWSIAKNWSPLLYSINRIFYIWATLRLILHSRIRFSLHIVKVNLHHSLFPLLLTLPHGEYAHGPHFHCLWIANDVISNLIFCVIVIKPIFSCYDKYSHGCFERLSVHPSDPTLFLMRMHSCSFSSTFINFQVWTYNHHWVFQSITSLSLQKKKWKWE